MNLFKKIFQRFFNKKTQDIRVVGATGAVASGLFGWLGTFMGVVGAFGGISAAWLLAPLGFIIGGLAALVYVLIKKKP